MTTTEQRPQTASDDQRPTDTQRVCVVAGSHFLADQPHDGTQHLVVGEDPNFPGGQILRDTQRALVTGDPNSVTTDRGPSDTQKMRVGGDGPNPRNGQKAFVAHGVHAVAGSTSPGPAVAVPSPMGDASGPATQAPPTASDPATPNGRSPLRAPVSPGPDNGEPTPIADAPILADPLLALAADVLDDLERIRIANENRLRQLTRSAEDKDGEERGFGLSIEDANVRSIVSLVAAMNCKSKVLADLGWPRPPKKRGQPCCLEHEAETNLSALLRKHPLAPWLKAQRGVGEKQGARLVAKVGDPYIKPDIYKTDDDGEEHLVEPSRLRLVSELWSYCGYGDPQEQVRRKGKKANWSSGAKMRAFNVTESCLKQLIKPCYAVYGPKGKGDGKGPYLYAVHVDDCACSPYRVAYDLGRAKYMGSVHPWECDRCTPKKKPPAPVGSPRSPKHQHQAAVRLATKLFLRDLWREAARLHGVPDDLDVRDTQPVTVVRAPSSSGDHSRSDTHGCSVTGGLIPPDGHGPPDTQGRPAVGALTLASGHEAVDNQPRSVAGEP